MLNTIGHLNEADEPIVNDDALCAVLADALGLVYFDFANEFPQQGRCQIPEMIAEIENSVLSEISERVSAQEFQITNINDASQQFLSFFETYGNTIYVLLAKSGSSDFRNRFKESAFAIYRKALAGKLNAEQIEYLITYVSSAGLGLVEHWYETGKKCSTDDFLKMMQSLIGTGIMGYMQGTMTVPNNTHKR